MLLATRKRDNINASLIPCFRFRVQRFDKHYNFEHIWRTFAVRFPSVANSLKLNLEHDNEVALDAL